MTRLNLSKAREAFPETVNRAALKEAEEKGTIPLRYLMRELGD